MGIKAKFISSLEKVFIDSELEKLPALEKLSVFKNERASFQLAILKDDCIDHAERLTLRISEPFSSCCTVNEVKNVPVTFPTFPNITEGYLRTEPGLYPDLLIPLRYRGAVSVFYNRTLSLFFKLTSPVSAGVYTVTAELLKGDEPVCSASFSLEVIDCELPNQQTSFTQWLHYDGIASYYNVEMFSDRYFEILENYIKTAVENGINTILTPVLTPPLDTFYTLERLTCQLVTIEKTPQGYTFDFSLFDRFVCLCLDCGVERFEICHLFTQWGAAHAPKVMAWENGVYKRIFGWETDSCSDEYRTFLRALLTSLKAHMAALDILENAIFHISDEPSAETAEKYSLAKSGITDILSDLTVCDALSDIDLYRRGIVDHPIPSIDHAEDFVNAGVDELWVYYCSAQYNKVSNRFIAMPSARTRILGIQLYKYNISGFLQWGYNFYNNCGSFDNINPYIFNDGDAWVPAGDTYSVYPSQDGGVYESLRLCVFYDALQDIRALKLAEKYLGREKIISLIDEAVGSPVTFREYPTDAEYILTLREKINEAVKEKLNG